MRGSFAEIWVFGGQTERGYVQSWEWKLESGHEFDELKDLHQLEYEPAYDQTHLEIEMGFLLSFDFNRFVDSDHC